MVGERSTLRSPARTCTSPAAPCENRVLHGAGNDRLGIRERGSRQLVEGQPSAKPADSVSDFAKEGSRARQLTGIGSAMIPLFALRIVTGMGGTMRAIQGRYARLTTGVERKPDPRYNSTSYGVSISGRAITSGFNRFYAHHPQIEAYSQWTEQIIKNLTCIFDEDARWKVALEELTFRHVAP